LITAVVQANIVNGTQGTVEDILLDPREPAVPAGMRIHHLQYPPAIMYIRPDYTPVSNLDRLKKGLIPLEPTRRSTQIHLNGKKTMIFRRQLALTPAYAFTDYKAQGQTIQPVIIDLGRTPTGKLNQFNAYMVMSRGTGRVNLRLLRDFDIELFTTYPNQDLMDCDVRLEALNEITKDKYANGEL
jgi:hypothetical protein